LLNAFDPDTLENIRSKVETENPTASPAEQQSAIANLQSEIIEAAASVFTGELNTYIENVRKAHEQVIDHINPDTLITAAWDKTVAANAGVLIKDFSAWIEAHKNEITALQIFYNQPWRRYWIDELKKELEIFKPFIPVLLTSQYLLEVLAFDGYEKLAAPDFYECKETIPIPANKNKIERGLIPFYRGKSPWYNVSYHLKNERWKAYKDSGQKSKLKKLKETINSNSSKQKTLTQSILRSV